jgi:hypothetical protein
VTTDAGRSGNVDVFGAIEASRGSHALLGFARD